MNYQKENTNDGEFSPVPDRALMALVDGELSRTRRRELLRQLDARSDVDDWRRCALMFLEDQALRAAFAESSSGIARDPGVSCALAGVAEAGTSPGSQIVPHGRSGDREDEQQPTVQRRGNGTDNGPRVAPVQSFWMLAAGLAVAFFVGMQVGSPWEGTGVNGGGPDGLPAAVPLAGDGSVPAGNQGAGQLFANTPRQGAVPDQRLRNAGNRQAADGASTVFVQDQNFWDRGGLVPRSVQQSFRNLGAEVQSERGWIPVRTSDGRQFVIPYEEVKFVPAEQLSY